MTRLKTLGMSLVAVLAITAVTAATASAAAPEFGRCVKKAAKSGGAGYSNAGCTTAVGSGAKFEWLSGPGPNTDFTTSARFVGTTKYKRCVKWQEAVEAGHTEEAANILAKYHYTATECEETLKEKEHDAPTVLETVGGLKIECTGVSGSGEYSGTKTVANVDTTFTGCEYEVSESTSYTCQSAGAEPGEIVDRTLDGELGIVVKESTPTKDTVGIALFPAPSSEGIVSKFSCDGIEITVTGSVIHDVLANKMVATETEKFVQKKGLQTPENFYGGEEDVLHSSFGGQSGLGLLTTLFNEEEIEVNTVV
jgi:hypothetical protein